MRKTFTALASIAAASLTISALAASAYAGAVRDHRGEGPPPPQVHLSCGSFKYCAKSGVVVRDHRNGATPGGK